MCVRACRCLCVCVFLCESIFSNKPCDCKKVCQLNILYILPIRGSVSLPPPPPPTFFQLSPAHPKYPCTHILLHVNIFNVHINAQFRIDFVLEFLQFGSEYKFIKKVASLVCEGVFCVFVCVCVSMCVLLSV